MKSDTRADSLSRIGCVRPYAPGLQPIINDPHESRPLRAREFPEGFDSIKWQRGHFCKALKQPGHFGSTSKVMLNGI